MRDPLMSWNVRVLDPVLRKALPWMYGMSENAIRWFLFGLASFILGWAGRRFYTKAWSALVHKTADMNTLVALGHRGRFPLLCGRDDFAWIFARTRHRPRRLL